MKKYFIILIFNFILLNDISEYKGSLYKIPMANVTISYQDTIFKNQESIKLQFNTETNQFASKIFKVDNYYETIIEKNTFDILSFEKITYQPGLVNKIKTINQNNNTIYIDTDTIIPKNHFNIFSLLYYLTITPFKEVKSIIQLEREGFLYNCIIKKIAYDEQYEYELIFELITKDQLPIIKNTDMFTWAIFKENSDKKIIVDKNTNIIKLCEFTLGLTSLKAYLEK